MLLTYFWYRKQNLMKVIPNVDSSFEAMKNISDRIDKKGGLLYFIHDDIEYKNIRTLVV